MPASLTARQTELRNLFSAVHASNDATDDHLLDTALGLERERVENGLSLGKLLVAHGNHRMEMGDVPYSLIRDLYRALDLPAETLLVDLGSGYGRVGFYGAILWEQPVHGIEIVPERVREAQRVRQNLGLSSLHFQMDNMLTCTWPEASHYVLMNSVLPSLMPGLMHRLAEIAQRRKIVVASVSTANTALQEQSWLREYIPELPSAEPPANLRIFKSG